MPANEQMIERAKAWLEKNTAMRWSTDPGLLSQPLEVVNRRPQQYAERMAAFAESLDRSPWVPFVAKDCVRPPSNGWYLCRTDFDEPRLRFWVSGGGFYTDAGSGKHAPDVIAYMPIPPYPSDAAGGG